MPGLRRYLERLRPSGVPGAAAPAGVPADRVAELTSELAPVFALLAGTEEELAEIRREASETAEALRRAAREQVESIAAQAEANVGRMRAETAGRARVAATTEQSQLIAAAEDEAAEVRRRAATRIPVLVQRTADRVARDLGLRPGEAPARERQP